MTEIDITMLAAWLNADDQWLDHVVAYGFICGCRHLGDDTEWCNIWQAQREIRAANAKLEKAQTEYEKMLAANKGMEIGK